jgi:hypothetical protein
MCARLASRAAGLRLQIVMSLAGLLVFAFVPLFFAIASIGSAALAAEREDGARAITRLVAHDVEIARPGLGAKEVLERYVRAGALEAVAVFERSGRMIASAGPEAIGLVPPSNLASTGERARVMRAAHGRIVEVAAPAGDQLVLTRMRAGESDRATPLVRLVATYVGIFAVALLV